MNSQILTSHSLLTSHSAPTPNTSVELFATGIQYYNRVFDTYYEDLIKLQVEKKQNELTKQSLDDYLARTKVNYLLPQSWKEARIERELPDIKLLNDKINELETQIEKAETTIQQRTITLKKEINGLTLYDDEIFKTLKRKTLKRDKDKSKTLRTVFTSMGIKNIKKEKWESIETTRTYLDHLFTDYKRKAIKLMNLKKGYYEQKIKLIKKKNEIDTWLSLYTFDETLYKYEKSIKSITKNMKMIESNIEKELIQEHKLIEDYESIMMGGSIKNSRKTMKRSSRI